MNTLECAAAGALALWPLHAALAQDATADEVPVRSLGVVVVNGSQPTSLPTQIPTTIESVTAKQIERSINATDSEDALKYLPSLLVRKRYIGDYNHAVLSTRASGTGNSARSIVYADGVMLSNLLGNGAAFTPRWGLVTPEAIERVDVLYGPFSAAYAGNSVGAVVDYVTRMPKAFEAHAKVGVFTQPFDLYGTHDTYSGWQASASLGDRAGAWSWWLNLNRLDSEGQPQTFATRTVAAGVAGTDGTPVTGAVAGLNNRHQPWYLLGHATQYHTVQDHLKAKLAYDIAPEVRATYTLGYWHNDSDGRSETYLRDAAGLPVYAGAINIGGVAYTGTGATGATGALGASDFPLTNDGIEHVMQALSVKSRSKGQFDWEVAASLYDYRKDLQRRSTTVQPGSRDGGAGTITDQSGTGWNTLALKGIWRPAVEHAVDFGVQQDRFELRSKVNATTDWIDGSPVGDPTSVFRGNTRLRSLYAQDAWAFAPGWKTVLGARLERWDAWGGRTVAATGSFDHADRAETDVSPKAALAYELSETWVLKGSLGRAVRYPTVSELYQGGINASGQIVNNDPNLEPEKSWTSELSAEWTAGAQRLRATLFHEDTRDALFSQTNTTVTPNVTNIQNVARVRTQGIELAFQGEDVAWRGFDLSASVTYADSRTVENANFQASVGKLQPRVPLWRATLLATWSPIEELSLSFGARYGSKQYGSLDNADVNGHAYQGFSPYFTTDLRVLWRFDRQWSAAFGIDNLNNDRYWNFHPYPQRTYSAELKFDL